MDDDHKHSGQFDASLELPGQKKSDEEPNPAADLIRSKVEAAYEHEPSAEAEVKEVEDQKPQTHRSKHQQFIYELTSSGRPLHEVQTAWHEYYAGLTDTEKHQVWQEFYTAQSHAAHHPAITHQEPKPEPIRSLTKKVTARVTAKPPQRPPKRQTEPHRPHHRPRPVSPLHSLFFGLAVGSIVILIFLFGFFNDRIIAPFIQPSRNSTNIPLIDSNSQVGSNPEVIIPKINVEIPVVYSVNTINDQLIQDALENGVVHYPDTAVPGQNGNVVIVGHSSNNILNPGKYKFAFTLLSRLQTGDTFYLLKDGKRYTYQVYSRQIVDPNDVSVLGAADKPATASLITCDPPGTSWHRLVVTGQQISPDPSVNLAASNQSQLTAKAAIIPGNAPSLWSRLVDWFKR